MDLNEQLKQLPDLPGVYLMKDSGGEIIYVGKAISLKKRVRQYFQASAKHSPKVASMVKNIQDFEYIIVKNEVEALVLESNLIKKNKPKYNIILRDDKQYPYIKVTVQERYPRVLKTRILEKDGAKYFGPFPSATAVNEAIEIFHRIFPIRDCNLNLNKRGQVFKPCLNYHIGRCLGPCRGDVDENLYNGMIDQILDFLSLKDDKLIKLLEDKMNKAAKEMNFEAAASFRDQVKALRTLLEEQRMDSASHTDQDVIAMARGVEEVVVQVYFIRDGKIVGREHYIMEDNFNDDRGEIMEAFLKQFYIGVAYIPKEILIEEEVSDHLPIQSWLSDIRGSKVTLSVPVKGDKAQLIRMAKENAIEMLNKYGDKFLRRHRENVRALEELQSYLELEDRPERIEAYDISNISGIGSVGSMVVFEKGETKKSDYRRFRIKSVSTPDDYKSMEEILRRRFLRGLSNGAEDADPEVENSFTLLPDLIMIDGGKGQVNRVQALLDELGVGIPVCGMVKDQYHKTRGLVYKNNEINPDKDGLAFKLIYRIQEEAHRFAISYHRSLRSKDMFRSELDGISGIGPKRKVELLRHFGSISAIKNAELNELEKVSGMNKKSAENLYNHFHNKKEE
ncbi:MAG: excinuclease ABC subunit UvrC [Gudongella sp.]|jgi:excinuclease ABC subunit C|nr:excinuclease ABC subunit UvrC [Gudongella sp.]